MFFFARPSDDVIADVLRRAELAQWSYDAVGATRGGVADLPDTITRTHFIDRNEAILGRGRAVFDRAAAALLAWRGFEIQWLELAGREHPVATGRTVATLVRALGIWAMNPCRVVYTIEDPDRVGFAYGTVDGHVARGEERFVVEHDPRTGDVRYEILAFSRPGHALARIGIPYVRRLQRRFGKDALTAMRRAAR